MVFFTHKLDNFTIIKKKLFMQFIEIWLDHDGGAPDKIHSLTIVKKTVFKDTAVRLYH